MLIFDILAGLIVVFILLVLFHPTSWVGRIYLTLSRLLRGGL